MDTADKLGPAGFGRFLHDAFDAIQNERASNNIIKLIYQPGVCLIYTAIDALLGSMAEQNPQDPLVKELRDELTQIDHIAKGSMYSLEYADFEPEDLNKMDAIIEKILRRLGVIRSGTVESEDSNECVMMEEELK